MDIGLLYQEYQRFTRQHSSTQQQQSQHQQHQGSTVQSLLFRGIQGAMPNLLAPCSPRSSRLSASLPPSVSDDRTEDGKTGSPLLPQPPTRQSSHAAAVSSSTNRRAQHSLPPTPVVNVGQHELYSRRSRNSPARSDKVSDRQKPRAVAVDIDGRGKSTQPLVVIDPKDVKSVLTQVVTATLRDLLGTDQEARERGLMRQIKRTLGQFEASMSVIVSQFAGSRHPQHSSGNQRACPIVNNSAGNFTVGECGTGTGTGVCTSSRAQTIRESYCCPSDDGTTGSTRVALVESDTDCEMPLRYRPPSSLGCPSCTGRQPGRQKNFSHAGGPALLGSVVASSDDILLAPSRGSSTVITTYLHGTVDQTFPKFSGPPRHPSDQLSPTQSSPTPLRQASTGCLSTMATASVSTATGATYEGGSAEATCGSTTDSRC